MAPELIFPEEELAVTTPRQLTHTVGPAVMKGVEIVLELWEFTCLGTVEINLIQLC